MDAAVRNRFTCNPGRAHEESGLREEFYGYPLSTSMTKKRG
jgi:hypothetical protein